MASPKRNQTTTSVLSALCYKDKLLLSYPEALALHSLRELDLPLLSTLNSPSPYISLEQGTKKDIIIATSIDSVVVYKIDEVNNINEICRWRPGISLTTSAISYTNEIVATGRADGIIQFWGFNEGSISKLWECAAHEASVNCIDFSSENNLLASSSRDCSCKIYNFQNQQLVKTLYFAEHDDTKNLPILSVKFSRSGDFLYTVAADQNSYITLWDVLENYKPIVTHRLHASPITAFTLSLDGFYLGIGTEDGFVKIMNTRTMEFEQDKEDMSAKVTALNFTWGSRNLIAAGSDGTLHSIANARGEGFFSKMSKVWVLTVFLLWIYLYLTNSS
ncbi:SED4 [Blepharisma stoltei]|uniref:Anaphase-promoting complex subunit 4 WD40 domain-containing protein n=1 Tax=Blepharisma stoltei TaxID=1481888 RepID=A0AAU9IV97_9CILI|nr:unnamed protein product [Blepharisma stoltei]